MALVGTPDPRRLGMILWSVVASVAELQTFGFDSASVGVASEPVHRSIPFNPPGHSIQIPNSLTKFNVPLLSISRKADC